MPTAQLAPYLHFNGDCADAMQFYQSCMGGKLTMQRFGETPVPCSEEQKMKIMHASLENDALSFMASDTQEGRTVTKGDNIDMSVAGTDEAQIMGIYEKLSAGGTVTMPLEKQFWGDVFGMLTDKFGIHWMFNISAKKD
jgi:PhnB protein